MSPNSRTIAESTEHERVRVLQSYGILDTPADSVFDDLTALAAKICGTPIALISLIDRDRQWFKSHHGITIAETPLSVSFCWHTIRRVEPMIVTDATKDPRFTDNELVTGGLHLRYYAGVPLITPGGHALGTLCVIDREPRQLSSEQLGALEIMTRQAMSQFELRRALAELRVSENRFESVARAVSDVIWDWDLARNTVWWSEGFLTAFGYDYRIADRVSSWESHLHPEDSARVTAAVRAAIQSPQSAWQNEYRFRRRDGTYAFVQERGQIMRHPNGDAYRIVGGMTDLTERKRLEAQHLRSQRVESIGALAGGMAHDLNNVLTPILLSISLLKDAVADDHESLERLNTIEISARHGANLIRQVLSFARGLEGLHAPTSVSQVLSEAVSLVRGTFPSSVRLVVEIASDLWLVRGDPTHLHQIFMNLLVNGRDAIGATGRVFVSARNAILSDAVCDEFKVKGGPFVVVTVRDTGTGIAPEVMDHIFEPFFTTKKQGAGTGLGLATVHGIVASHGGFVKVISEPGAGATFEVCLPADRAARLADTAASQSVGSSSRSETVLLVDDEESIRSIGKQTLRQLGYRVLTAENGADALSVLHEYADQVSVVLIDLMMPIMDGAACIEKLRQTNPRLPIVMASGMPPSSDVLARLGVKHLLSKPYTAASMAEMLRRALDATVA
ncbi:MAG: ATP-binding protein [Opitutus sp.]